MTGNRPKTKITEKADQLKYQRTEDMMGDTKGKYKTGRWSEDDWIQPGEGFLITDINEIS